MSFAAVDLELNKLACTASFSDEMQEDSGFLIRKLQMELTRLACMVRRASR